MSKKAVNWNDLEDNKYKVFWDQNVRQFWVDEEIPVSDDKLFWNQGDISDLEKDTYEKILAGLTLLDTEQGGVGMPNIILNVKNLHQKAIFCFMCMMEQMHAKSYSTIFSTLSSTNRINELFDWVYENELLQKKLAIIENYYNNIHDDITLFKALCAAVLLETFLFYSGFYYPLWWAGHGKLIKSGEIIALIVRDESIHGVFTGLVAQELYATFDDTTKQQLEKELIATMLELHDIERLYTKELYGALNLEQDVMTYVEYNADKALMNLGFKPYFNISESDVNPIVINGINTETKNHDFFSTKGNGYIKTLHVETLSDDIFD